MSRHYTPDNEAAMREALVELRDAARNFCHQILNSKYNDIMDEYKCRERGFPALLDLRYAIQKANFALSAPARNCDIHTDFNDAITTLANKRNWHDGKWNSERYSILASWLLASAAEEGGSDGI